MRIVKIQSYSNGSHENQESVFPVPIPDGWAVIPKDMETPSFPFGAVEAEEIGGVMTVTRWTPGTIPEPEPEPEPQTEPDTEYVTYGELAAAIREGVNSVD